eukprot:63240-Hanusia_phi.AAC.1
MRPIIAPHPPTVCHTNVAARPAGRRASGLQGPWPQCSAGSDSARGRLRVCSQTWLVRFESVRTTAQFTMPLRASLAGYGAGHDPGSRH